MHPSIANQPIANLLHADQKWALGLHGYGISLFGDSEQTLTQACKARGLSVANLVASLEAQAAQRQAEPNLEAYPTHLVIAYLRHAHHLFIREKLPFIKYLVANMVPEACGGYANIVADLKVVYPLFAQDFIEHIFEEEDTLFLYIQLLLASNGKKTLLGQAWLQMQKISIAELANAHDGHDDEMQGIRKLSSGYAIEEGMPLALKVVYHELRAFEKELLVHARVENTILFPKALHLENYIRTCMSGISRWN